MRAALRSFVPAVVAAALLLAAAGSAQAQYGRGYPPVSNRMPGWDWERIYPYSPYNRGRNPYNPIVPPDGNHMPGWDWRYIYPYSDYNYGRNPYNPIVAPYPVATPLPVPAYGPHNADAPDGASFPTASGQQVLMPHPAGPTQTPPPGAAIVQVRVPDAEAHVLFDGERTFTEGTNRYFITPELPEGKPYHYAVAATWKRDGNDVTMERQIEVKTGHTTVVDFARPAK